MSVIKVARDAVTGRYVTMEYAEQNPETTVVEEVDTDSNVLATIHVIAEQALDVGSDVEELLNALILIRKLSDPKEGEDHE